MIIAIIKAAGGAAKPVRPARLRRPAGRLWPRGHFSQGLQPPLEPPVIPYYGPELPTGSYSLYGFGNVGVGMVGMRQQHWASIL